MRHNGDRFTRLVHLVNDCARCTPSVLPDFDADELDVIEPRADERKEALVPRVARVTGCTAVEARDYVERTSYHAIVQRLTRAEKRRR